MVARSNTHWRILPMFPEHVPQVLQIERSAYFDPWPELNFHNCLKTPGYSGWVAEDGAGVIRGYAMVGIVVLNEMHLLNLCVAPGHQGLGLGRTLLEHAIELATAFGVSLLQLDVRPSNQSALHLYQSRGFERLGLRQDYYPTAAGREDALILGYRIA